MRLAQNKRACISDEIWVHESDDDIGKTEEPFDEPWDEHVGPEDISTANVYGPETAHSAAHRRGGVWSSDITKRAQTNRNGYL